MTEKQKETAIGLLVLVVLLGLIMWAMWGAFGHAAKQALGGTTINNAAPGSPGGVDISESPYAPPSSGGGCCGGCGGGSSGCPVSPSAIGSVNQILSVGANAANNIYAAGDATIQAMIDVMNQEDPLYSITTG